MQIKIQLVAFLKQYSPGDDDIFTQDILEGSKVKDVIELLGIPETIPRIALINGTPTAEESPLNDGDEIVLMNPLEGG